MKRDGRKLNHKTLEELRRMAVRRVIEDKESPSEVAADFGFCRNYLYPWLRKFAEEGWDALCEKIAEGPQPKLTDKQRQQVRRWIVGRDPRQDGFEFGLWTRRIVADLIARKLGMEIGLTAVGRLLAQLNITAQKPLRRAYERDPQEVDKWVQKTYPKLRVRARKHGAKIFFLDEAGFSSEPNLGRTYGLKGQTPVVSTTGQRQKINAISAISARGEFWCQEYSGKLNAARFVEFLKPIFNTFEKWAVDNQRLAKTTRRCANTLCPDRPVPQSSRMVGGIATPAAQMALCASPKNWLRKR